LDEHAAINMIAVKTTIGKPNRNRLGLKRLRRREFIVVVCSGTQEIKADDRQGALDQGAPARKYDARL
jgi:hypothetical protein